MFFFEHALNTSTDQASPRTSPWSQPGKAGKVAANDNLWKCNHQTPACSRPCFTESTAMPGKFDSTHLLDSQELRREVVLMKWHDMVILSLFSPNHHKIWSDFGWGRDKKSCFLRRLGFLSFCLDLQITTSNIAFHLISPSLLTEAEGVSATAPYPSISVERCCQAARWSASAHYLGRDYKSSCFRNVHHDLSFLKFFQPHCWLHASEKTAGSASSLRSCQKFERSKWY